MKKKRLLMPVFVLLTAVGLTSCGLFNDDDMKINNTFTPTPVTPPVDPTAKTVEGVTSRKVDAVPDTLCFKAIPYATDDKIVNTYKEGGINHVEYNVNGGNDYEAKYRNSNNYDLYVPDSASRTDKHVVLLFIHGGAWISGFKTDVNPYVYEFANKGYITATIQYTLLKREMNDNTLSIFRDLDEIDACIKSIKKVLGELEFDTSKTSLVIGGASSGSHLAMLYAYSRGNQSVLPIKFIVDAVGPVDIDPYNWKAFVNETDAALASIEYNAIEDQRSGHNLKELGISGQNDTWNDYQTMKIANGMCGLPYSLTEIEASSSDQIHVNQPNAASNSMLKNGGGEDQVSVTYWIDKITDASQKYPIICAYSGKDRIVGIAQYAKLQHSLESKGIEKAYFYFKDCGHADISNDTEQYQALIDKIQEWCVSKGLN